MRFYAHEKLAIVVDGPNFKGAAHALEFDVDWGKLHEFFARQAILTNAIYFTKLREPADGEFNPVRKLVDWLDYNGWTAITSTRDTDVDLAVEVLDLAPHINHLVLASGDARFASLVESIQRQACRVTVLSTIQSHPPHCPDDLRRTADQFIDLADLRETIARPARAREALSA